MSPNSENFVNAWQLIRQGEFQAAIDITASDFEQNGNIFSIRNQVIALLNLPDFQKAVQVSEVIIDQTKGSTDSDFIHWGIALWSLGEKEKAVSIWIKADNTQYTDEAGGLELQLILMYAALVLEDITLKTDAVNKIKKLIRRKHLSWLGRLAMSVMKDEMPDERLLPDLLPTVMADRYMCQLYFVRAIIFLQRQEVDSCNRALEFCIAFGRKNLLESFYYLAKVER